MLVALVPFMVVAPNCHTLLPSVITVGLLSKCGVVELPCDFLLQPTTKMVTAMVPVMIAFFIKYRAA